MSSKPLLIGEAPGRNGDPALPLGGRAARTLVVLGGWEDEVVEDDYRAVLASRFDLMNLLDEYPGHDGKGTRWDGAEAKRRARGVDLRSHIAVLYLGRRVAAAFDVRTDWGEWTPPWVAYPPVAVLPHPSGINRAWNDVAVRARAKSALRFAAWLGRLQNDVLEQKLD